MFILTMVFQALEALTILPLAITDAAKDLSSCFVFFLLLLKPDLHIHIYNPHWHLLHVSFAGTFQLETLWPSESADHSAKPWDSTSSKWRKLLELRSSSRSFRPWTGTLLLADLYHCQIKTSLFKLFFVSASYAQLLNDTHNEIPIIPSVFNKCITKVLGKLKLLQHIMVWVINHWIYP